MLFNKKSRYIGKKFSSYTLSALIGQGRYGTCFLARSDTGQTVVIKKFKPNMFRKNAAKNEHEAVILSQLSDQRIPDLLGVINAKNFYGFVLEFKPGFTVKEMLFKQFHVFSDEEIFNIGIKLIEIIKYLHENGVVHRDIRTPNVLIDQNEVYLVDFGLARWSNPDHYPYDLDFSYLGDFLLYLLYSSFEATKKNKKLPWFEELALTLEQKLFLKKLLGLERTYTKIEDVAIDFIRLFKI